MRRVRSLSLLLVPLLSLSCHCNTTDDPLVEDSDLTHTDAAETDAVETDAADTAADTEVAETDDTDAGCRFALAPVAAPGDKLVFSTSSCWVIEIQKHTITVLDPNGLNKVEHWGDPHENLNGKHIKDWEGDRRTLLIPGGVRLTMHTFGPQGVVERTSLYDGDHAREIVNDTNTVEVAIDDPAEAAAAEAAEADGETAEITPLLDGALAYDNVYTQDEDEHGVPGPKVPNVQKLGESGGASNPNNVRDYYDDPRLGHT